MVRRRIAIAYWVAALGLFMPGAVYAYIDPATTTYIVQIITALVVTLGVSLSVFLYRFRMISAGIRYRLAALRYRGRRSGTGGGAGSSARGSCLEADGDRPTETGAAGSGFALRKREYIYPVYALPAAPQPPADADMAESFAGSGLGKISTGRGAYIPPRSRGFKGRLIAALPLSLAVSLSFILFGCMELVMQNTADMPFSLGAVMPVLALAAAACTGGICIIISLFRGRVYDIIVSLVLSGLIAGYLQGNFLNIGMADLGGDVIDWSLYRPQMAVSLGVWLGVLAVVFLLPRFSAAIRRGIAIFVPVMLLLIQGAGLISIAAEKAGAEDEWGAAMFWEQSTQELSTHKLLEPASDKNVIVFVLDLFDQKFVEEIIAGEPQFFDALDGFTMFDDNITYAASTFPSVTSMLTGNRYRWDMTDTDYFNYAWENAALMRAMKERGVDIRLYSDRGYMFNNIEQLRGIASNITEEGVGVNSRIALVKLLKLSAFKYAPMPAKQPFWLTPSEFTDALVFPENSTPYVIDDFEFYRNITETGLSVSDDTMAFSYYHMLGPHAPRHMDRDINETEGWTLPVDQAMGSMKIVFEYLRQLKELGLYDDAAIIITADHGDFVAGSLEEPAQAALFVKPSGSAGTPLSVSRAPVSPDQLPGTIMEGLFGNTEEFGPGYLDIAEGANVLREYDFRRFRFEIEGDGRDFANWEHVGDYSDEFDDG